MQTALTTGRIPLRLDSSAFKNTFPDNTASNFKFPTYMFKPLYGTWFAHLHSMEFQNSIINIHEFNKKGTLQHFTELANSDKHDWIMQIALHRLYAHGLGLEKMYTWSLGGGVTIPALEKSTDPDVLVNVINEQLRSTYVPWSPTLIQDDLLIDDFEVYVYIDNPSANQIPNPSAYKTKIAIAYTNGKELGVGRYTNEKIRSEWFKFLSNFTYDRQVWTGASTKLVQKTNAFTTQEVTISGKEYTKLKWTGKKGDRMSFKVRSRNNFLQNVLGFPTSTTLERNVETTTILHRSEAVKKIRGSLFILLNKIKPADLKSAIWVQMAPVVNYHTRFVVKASFTNGTTKEKSWKIYPGSYVLQDEETLEKKHIFILASPNLSTVTPLTNDLPFEYVMFQTLSKELFAWCGVIVTKTHDEKLRFDLTKETIEKVQFTFEEHEGWFVPAFGFRGGSRTLNRGLFIFSPFQQNLNWFKNTFFIKRYSRLSELVVAEKLSPFSIRFNWIQTRGKNQSTSIYSGYSAASISMVDSLSKETRIVHIGENKPLTVTRLFNDTLFTATNEPQGFRTNLKINSEPLLMYKTPHNIFNYPKIFVYENSILFELGQRTHSDFTKAVVEWMGMFEIPAPGSYRTLEIFQNALNSHPINISETKKIKVSDFLIVKRDENGRCRFEITGTMFSFVKVTINPTLAYLLGLEKEKGKSPLHFTLVSPVAVKNPVNGYIANIPLNATDSFTAPLVINLKDGIEHLVIQMPGLLEPSILGESRLPVLTVIPLTQKEGEIVSVDENLPLPILLRTENLSNCRVLLTDTTGREIHLMSKDIPTRMTVVLQNHNVF